MLQFLLSLSSSKESIKCCEEERCQDNDGVIDPCPIDPFELFIVDDHVQNVGKDCALDVLREWIVVFNVDQQLGGRIDFTAEIVRFTCDECVNCEQCQAR